ncbi:YqzL family protein [Bacillus sp. JJ1562]|uniref:YqzL family protein n=1 Tax=Bacillus sp. JJ1562 TaxID=3122960 RepID=UPI003F68AE38
MILFKLRKSSVNLGEFINNKDAEGNNRERRKLVNNYFWNTFIKTGSIYMYLLLKEFERMDST